MESTKSQRIVVLWVRALETPKGSLRAFAAVRIAGKSSVTINDLRIIQKDEQAPWVSMPQNTWKDPEGKLKYSPVVEIEGPLKDEIASAVLAEWEGRP